MWAAAEDFNGQHKKLFSKAVSIYTLKHYNQCQIKYYCSQIMATLRTALLWIIATIILLFIDINFFSYIPHFCFTYLNLCHLQNTYTLVYSATQSKLYTSIERTATMALLCKYYSHRLRLAKAICLEGHVRMVVFCQEWKRTRNITTVDLIK